MQPQDQDRLAFHLLGTCISIETALAELNIACDEETALHKIAYDVEACSDCGWWFEPSELVAEDGEAGTCKDCRE